MRRLSFFPLIGFLVLAACQPTTASTPLASTRTAAPSPKKTATPSLVPATATPTATPAPPQRFFTEDFNGELPYWSIVQVDNGGSNVTPGTSSGFLTFDLSTPNQWVYALYGAQSYADVRVDAQIEVHTGQDGSVGIVCRYDKKKGWYEFNIYADQTYTLLFGRWLADGVPQYLTMVRTTSEKIKAGANEIGLLCEGDTLTPFINNVQMRKWPETKYGLTDGEIGVSGASFTDVPFRATYDWVKVSRP